jgi:hypothetical protein
MWDAEFVFFSVEILEKDRNYQLQLQGWDYVNVLENQLFFKAVSEVISCYLFYD